MATSTLEQTSPRPRPRFRMLEVRGVERLTQRMMRVTLGGPEAEGFENPAPTQHVKLIIPEPGQTRPVLPDPSAPRGAVGPDGRRPTMRTLTVRRFAPTPGELQVDFVLHGEGPASQWAERAQVGGLVAVAGPGGRRYAIDAAAQRYLLIGDATALPAIGTVLDSLPAGARADVYAEVAGPDDELAWTSAAQVRVTWLHRSPDATPVEDGLLAALADAEPLSQWDRVWLACEATVMRRIRRSLLEDGQLAQDHIVTRGYWKVGGANYPDHDYGQD
jgi:NADPH-dependent ferric siderophore reductase